MSLEVILMSLMSLGADFLVRMREKGGRLMSLGVLLMSLGAGFEQELGDEFGGDCDEFDEFGVISLCVCDKRGMCLMRLGLRLMSLAVGLEKELRDEFGDGLSERDEFGGHFLVCLGEKRLRLMSLGSV